MKSIETQKFMPQETLTGALSDKIAEAQIKSNRFHYASMALAALGAAGGALLLVKGTALGIVIALTATAGLVPVYARKKYWDSRIEAHKETKGLIAERSIDLLQETYALLNEFNRSSTPAVAISDIVKLSAADVPRPVGAANQNYLIRKPTSPSPKKPPGKV